MSQTSATSQPALLAASGAAARAADVLLRAVGGRSVLLRIPAPAVAADPAEQLGLATPQFQDLPLAPVVFRKARASAPPGKPPRSEMLVSASIVTRLAGSQSFASASALFASALGVLVDDVLFEILASTEEQVFGQPYVFRLVLRVPQADIV
ncbi:MAG: hypothetical protein M3O02_13315 [Acidobacteriota bacterium]|nr:hypothetical protein [Acidobacteriota bacterium]